MRRLGSVDDDACEGSASRVVRGLTDEMPCVGRWLAAHASKIRLEVVSGILAEPIAEIDTFKPARESSTGGHQRLQLRQRPAVVDRR